MTGYSPLTDDDPFVGDASAVRDYTRSLRKTRDGATEVAMAVKDVADGSEATWVGDAAQRFRARAADGSAPLNDLAERLSKTASIMDDYATALSIAQYCGRALVSQAQYSSDARQLIKQQLDAATHTPVPDPFTVSNLRIQLADQDHARSRLQREFDALQSDFEESASKTREKLFKLWSLDSRFDLAATTGNLKDKPKPKLHNAPDLGDGKDVRSGTTKSGNRVQEVTGRSPGLIGGRGGGAKQTTTTKSKFGAGPGNLPEQAYEKKVNYSSDGKIPPAEPKKAKVKKVAGSTTAKVASASSDASTFRGAQAKKQGKNFGGDAHAGVMAEAKANASASIGADGLKATAGASASAKIEAKASGTVTSKYVNGDASVHASVGAEAEGKATLGIGKDGVNAGIEAKAFVGGEVGVDGNVDIAGIGAGGHAAVTYGIGAELDVKAKVSLDKVSIKADIGATLGFGGHVSVDINIHPKELIHNVAGLFGL